MFSSEIAYGLFWIPSWLTIFQTKGSTKNFSSIPLSRYIMKERLRWLGYILQMKDDRLLKIILFGQHSRAKRKAGRPRQWWEGVVNNDLKEMGVSWEGVNREALNIGLEEERALLCWPQAAWCCGELLLLVAMDVGGGGNLGGTYLPPPHDWHHWN